MASDRLWCSSYTGISHQLRMRTRYGTSCQARSWWLVCPMSHRWSLLFDKDNVKWEPEFDFNKCKKKTARKWIPLAIEIPAGSLLFMSALMHAGYGVWAIDKALVNSVPSMT